MKEEIFYGKGIHHVKKDYPDIYETVVKLNEGAYTGKVIDYRTQKLIALGITAAASDDRAMRKQMQSAIKEFDVTKDEIVDVLTKYRSVPQELNLPMAPQRPIICRPEPDRPQPRKDRDADKGMAVSVGRLRPCPVFDLRFVGLSHNTLRGAAGGGILNAELLKARGYL